MSRIVVSDSTCLIGLERIQRFDLLQEAFDSVLIPPEVAREFGNPPAWLIVQAPQNRAAVEAFQLVVDTGEAEAIALAKELGCRVILDDQQARKLAARQGVRCLGLLGLLLRAKREHRLAAVKPVVEALRDSSFFVSETLLAEVLRLAGE